MLEKTIEHRHARAAADDLRVHHDAEEAAIRVRAVELRLPDFVHFVLARHAGVVRREAEEEVRRIVHLPTVRHLQKPPPALRRGQPVRAIVADEAAVVPKAVVEQQVEGMRAGVARGRAVADRGVTGEALEALRALQQHIKFGLAALVTDELVFVAVVADLVTAGDHPLDEFGILVGRPAGHEERRFEIVFLQQAEDARHSDPGAVLAARHLSGKRLAHGAEPQRFRIEVETQPHGAALIVRPHT